MIRCTRPGCTGTIEETGFCDRCHRRPPADAGPTGLESIGAGTTGSRADSGVRTTQSSGGSELLSLPVFEFPDPSSRIMNNPEVPTKERRCGQCGTEVGGGYGGQAPVAEGFCPTCKRPYSFLPSLQPGDLVGGQYEVEGCFARGGFGWVYLARDRNLDDNLVVLKGLIDTGDAALAAAERRALTMMHHPNIVRIFNFVTYRDMSR
jgi:serine/threonine-protein kinase PknG